VEIAKALILAGRPAHDQPWPSVSTGPKHLVPVANQPILFHNLESLRRAGLIEATIALDQHSAEIREAVGDGSPWGLTVQYVDWHPQSGVDGALDAARKFVGEEPLLVEPGDILHRELIHPHIAAFARDELDAMALCVPVPGVPAAEPMVGGYLFSSRAVTMLLDGAASGDPFVGVQRGGGHVRAETIDGCLPCHGDQDQLLEGNRRMLEQLRTNVAPALPPDCEVQGRVLIHPTAELDHTLIRGPAIIGARTRLSHAYVGPYSSIGADVVIEGSQIEHSIVLDGAELLHVGTRVDTSVIGRGARVHRAFAPTNALRLSVGDGAEVRLS
jgi:glucose-1-phosphate thymidylyltransferase